MGDGQPRTVPPPGRRRGKREPSGPPARRRTKGPSSDLSVGTAQHPSAMAVPHLEGALLDPPVRPAQYPAPLPLTGGIGPLLLVSVGKAMDPGAATLAVLERSLFFLPIRPTEDPVAMALAVPHRRLLRSFRPPGGSPSGRDVPLPGTAPLASASLCRPVRLHPRQTPVCQQNCRQGGSNTRSREPHRE